MKQQNQSPKDKIITITNGFWLAIKGGVGGVQSQEYTLNGDAFSMTGKGGEYGIVDAIITERYLPGERISLNSSFLDQEHFGTGRITVKQASYDYRYTQANVFYLAGKLNFTGEAKVPPPTNPTDASIKFTAPFKFEGHLEGRPPDHPQTPAFFVQLKGSGQATIELRKNADGSLPYYVKSIRYEFQRA